MTLASADRRFRVRYPQSVSVAQGLRSVLSGDGISGLKQLHIEYLRLSRPIETHGPCARSSGSARHGRPGCPRSALWPVDIQPRQPRQAVTTCLAESVARSCCSPYVGAASWFIRRKRPDGGPGGRAVTRGHVHPRCPQEAGQSRAVGAGTLHREPGHRPEASQPAAGGGDSPPGGRAEVLPAGRCARRVARAG
jgi:hypothetical protein